MSDGQVFTGYAFLPTGKPLPLAGYAARTGTAPPQPHRLEANWVGWHTGNGLAILLAVDTLFSSSVFEDCLRDRLGQSGAGVAALTVVASHTHFAPSLDPGKPRLGLCDTGFLEQSADDICKGILKSLRDPVRIASGGFAKHTLKAGIYRRRWGVLMSRRPPFLQPGTQILPDARVPIPRELRLWVFYAADGRPRCLLASWPCHPVSRADPLRVSADFPGVIRQTVRQGLGPDLPVLFLPGPCGDIRPDMRRSRFDLRNMRPYPLQERFARITPERERMFDCAVAQGVRHALAKLAPLPGFDAGAGPGMVQDRMSLTRATASGQEVLMPVSGINLPGLAILAAGAELSSGWAGLMGFPEASASCLLTGYAGDVFGYLPTDAQIPHGGYEVGGFRTAFGFSGSYSADRPVGPDVLAGLNAVLQNMG